MALPLEPPIQPMLAKLQDEVPDGDGWLYEPKWDGFRAIVFRDGDDVHVASRDQKPLQRYFPELPPALRTALPKRCIVDGEVIVVRGNRLDFDALQMRIHPAESRIKLLSKQTPAGFVAFDLLAMGSQNLCDKPFDDRRKKLLSILEQQATITKPVKGTQIRVTPQTTDRDEAIVWLETLEDIGLDGIIAKRLDGPYVPGKRTMIKIKQHRTADCVVGGYRLSKTGDGVGSLLLGLYDDAGTLHFVGHTSAFKAKERKELLRRLKPLEGNGFGRGRTPGAPSRWATARNMEWVSLKPELVVEVKYDKMQGERFRHAAGLVRWREDKPPKECTLDQVLPS
jgi:ATP-dependent DNA ligase